MTNLEPDVLLGQRGGGDGADVSEALGTVSNPTRLTRTQVTYLKTLVILLLLFVDYAEAEVNLICLVKIGRHAHDLRERLFSMLQGPIAIIQDTNSVPQRWLLDGRVSSSHDYDM